MYHIIMFVDSDGALPEDVIDILGKLISPNNYWICTPKGNWNSIGLTLRGERDLEVFKTCMRIANGKISHTEISWEDYKDWIKPEKNEMRIANGCVLLAGR